MLKNIHLNYKILKGPKGKIYYVVSEKFWKFIQKQMNGKMFKTKRKLAQYISKITDNKIKQKSIENWFYCKKKPIVVKNFRIINSSKNTCKHGFKYFCSICSLNITKIRDCPAPLFWTTHPQGKLFVYQNYWDELKFQIENINKFGVLLSSMYNKIQADERQIRNWKVGKNYPKIYTNDEFKFSNHNLYFLGLFLSDGHLRNNGSKFSYSFQVGSSDIFQGYWYPQLIQRVLSIFKHKKRISNTYLVIDKTYLSSPSPIFIETLLRFNLIRKIHNSLTSGFKKIISNEFLKETKSHFEYFQGIFDGDGSYSKRGSPLIDLSTSPDIDYTHLIDRLYLIPTITTHNKKKFLPYAQRKSNSLYMVRFAPGSLKHLPNKCTSQLIVKQLEFFIESASNSIRPDKVHKLVNILKKITSKKYGENKNSIPIQREVRSLAIEKDFKTKIRKLEERYPIRRGMYQAFMPKWAENLCSKEEAWNFFFEKENLTFKYKHKFQNLNFSKGIPINHNILKEN